MKLRSYSCLVLVLVLACSACSGPKDADREYKAPVASGTTGAEMASDAAIQEKMPIDPGDVDSGVYIDGKLALVSTTPYVSAEYIETQRNTLSMTIITVKTALSEDAIRIF